LKSTRKRTRLSFKSNEFRVLIKKNKYL